MPDKKPSRTKEEPLSKAQKLALKNLRKLVTKGKKQGYVTQEDVMELFPQAEENIEELDSLYEKLMNEGVDVFDTASEKEAEKIKNAEDLLAAANIRLDKTVSSDPVRM